MAETSRHLFHFATFINLKCLSLKIMYLFFSFFFVTYESLFYKKKKKKSMINSITQVRKGANFYVGHSSRFLLRISSQSAEIVNICFRFFFLVFSICVHGDVWKKKKKKTFACFTCNKQRLFSFNFILYPMKTISCLHGCRPLKLASIGRAYNVYVYPPLPTSNAWLENDREKTIRVLTINKL